MGGAREAAEEVERVAAAQLAEAACMLQQPSKDIAHFKAAGACSLKM